MAPPHQSHPGAVAPRLFHSTPGIRVLVLKMLLGRHPCDSSLQWQACGLWVAVGGSLPLGEVWSIALTVRKSLLPSTHTPFLTQQAPNQPGLRSCIGIGTVNKTPGVASGTQGAGLRNDCCGISAVRGLQIRPQTVSQQHPRSTADAHECHTSVHGSFNRCQKAAVTQTVSSGARLRGLHPHCHRRAASS